MNVSFSIKYRTVFGEELVLCIVRHSQGGAESLSRHRLATTDGETWAQTIALDRTPAGDVLEYFYAIERQGVLVRREWDGARHRLAFSASKARRYVVLDRWADLPEDAYRYTSAFTDCIDHQKATPLRATAFVRTLRLSVRAPQLRDGMRLCLCGADACLGAWDASHALEMTQTSACEWTADVDAAALTSSLVQLKFVAKSASDGAIWEEGANRALSLPPMEDGEVRVVALDQAFFAIPNERVAGTLIPVFSLRSHGSFGVGDFGDLAAMVDLVAATGQRVLQILPVNDTTITKTWTDSYPYSAISIFALHPMFADLRQLPPLVDARLAAEMAEKQQALNALPQIDYEGVNAAKLAYLRAIFAQEGAKTLASAAFKRFFAETQAWLVPYAQYCLLRDAYGTADFNLWPDHKTWDEADRRALSDSRTKAFREASFAYWVQFVLSEQLSRAHEHARQRGVVLKGDIPIGVNRSGCDVWMEPKYFNLNGQAGAPPDDFAADGQNWGFPTYNWEAMLEDDCAWWVRRFQNMARYFDAYRIDHVLGFFRIWEIPIDAVSGLLGQFAPSQGLTREEIESYGLPFLEQHFTEPFISEWILDRVFGAEKEAVKAQYLTHAHDDIYKLRPEVATQRQVEALFEGRTDEASVRLRNGLYCLIANVLFLRDRRDPNLFHPRISAQHGFTYEALWDADKAAFNRLYDDYFYRRNNQFWYVEAMKKLPRLVEATRMLVCAEDLGMVPACVAWVMNELRILSLEVQSMPKDPSVRFGHLSAYPYRSVCTISSHDMPTLRQWWDEDEGRTQAYYNTMLYRSGGAPHPLPGWLARDIVSRQLTSPSMLCILALQDWLAVDEALRLPDADAERINIPANPKHYWRYRMHLNIEDLAANASFINNIKELVAQSGR